MPQNRRGLTAQFIESLRAGDLPVDHTDAAIRGLQLRVAPSGCKTWLFRYKFHKKPCRIRIGRFPTVRLADARIRAAGFRALLSEGIDPKAAQAQYRRPGARGALNNKRKPESETETSLALEPNSVDFLVEEFKEKFLKPNRANPNDVIRIFNHDVLPYWSGRDARTIKPREVIQLLDRVVARGSKVMANRVASALRQLFLFGVHRAIIDWSPVQLLMKPGGREKPRRRIFSERELEAFLLHGSRAARTRTLGHILRILLLTAVRRGELCKARWADVDFVRGTWDIPEQASKSRIPLKVPLTDSAAAEFRALRELAGNSDYVLPRPGGNGPIPAHQVTRRIARCQRRFQEIAIEKFIGHDLRRTCRTYLSRLGVDQLIAERVLNHQRRGIEGVYDLYEFLPQKRQALEAWEKYLKSLEAQVRSSDAVQSPCPPVAELEGRNLNDHELRAFVVGYRKAARTRELGHALKILLLTAARASELSSARWADVNLKDGVWFIPANPGKARQAQLIPLTSDAIAEFFGLIEKSQRGGFVISLRSRNAPVNRNYLNRRLTRCQQRFERLGINQLAAADLRRSCAEYLSRKGLRCSHRTRPPEPECASPPRGPRLERDPHRAASSPRGMERSHQIP